MIRLVNPASTSTSLSTDANPSVYGQNILTASVSSQTLGTPKKLFDWQKPTQARSGLRYDVAPDGRFLMAKAQAPSPDVPTNVSLIVNWLADLRTR